MTSPSPQCVGQEFVRQYYTMLHEAPDYMHRFYSHDSSFIHGGLENPGESQASVHGQSNIHKKILSLNFRDCHARIRQVDSLGTIDNAVVVQVSGELSNDGQPMRKFMQTFLLAPQSPKKYYVHNDIFRYQDEVFIDENGSDGSPTISTTTQAEPSENGVSIHLRSQENPLNQQKNASQQQHILQLTSTTATNGNKVETPVNQHCYERPGGPNSVKSKLLLNGINSTKPNSHESPSTISNGQGLSNNNSGEQIVVNDGGGGEFVGNNHGDVVSSTTSAMPIPCTRDHHQHALSPSTSPTPFSHKSKHPVSWASLMSDRRTSTTISYVRCDITGQSRQENNGYPFQNSSGRSPDAGLDPPNVLPSQLKREDNLPSNVEKSQAESRMERNETGSDWKSENLKSPEAVQLFVGNLPNDVSTTALRNFFSKFGEVLDVRVNRKLSFSRDLPNFGFVKFESPEIARRVLESRPLYLDNGHRLNVEEKKSDQLRPAGNNSCGQQRYGHPPQLSPPPSTINGRGWWGGYKGNGRRVQPQAPMRAFDRYQGPGMGGYRNGGRMRNE